MNPRREIRKLPPAYLALAAAALFGASTPASKLLVGTVQPQLLAGLLYLGSGFGLTIYIVIVRKIFGGGNETAVKEADYKWLGVAILFGGIAAPLLLMFGLMKTAGAAASLLLNLEGVFTALLAWFVFKENFDRRVMLGMLSIVTGGLLLSFSPGTTFVISLSSLAIIGACLCWGLDNNFTRNVSASDAIQIAAIKGLVAGVVNCTLALLLGSKWPSPGLLLIAGLTGFLGYGVSLSLYIKSLRYLGTARSGAYFSTAPFAGALLSVYFLHEPITVNLSVAGLLMALGVWLHLTEKHEHEHFHPGEKHEHIHTHDEHHAHEHIPEDLIGEPHSHLHVHHETTHTHPHFPDIDHRHDHPAES